MRSRATGLIGSALGLILAIIGGYVWFGLSHHKLGPGLLVVGIILLAFGAWAYMGSAKAKGAM
jgi:hypothetical protein